MAGKYEELERVARSLGDTMPPTVRDSLAWSHIVQGNVLFDQARKKAGEQADALFGEAYEKYAQGLAIEPDDHEALYDWGTALLDEANTKAGAEADALFERARTKLLQAELLKECAGAYNLACVAALRAREEECREWLNVDKRCGTLPDRRHLESDTDLDGVRDEPWFREFLAGL